MNQLEHAKQNRTKKKKQQQQQQRLDLELAPARNQAPGNMKPLARVLKQLNAQEFKA